jgi:GTP diphosphokinase / guanosine-3',5'-bis(diphosphate) 3'-diphosphatase
MLKEVVVKAYSFSELKHKDQVRKYSGIPYFTHPKAVARILEELVKDPEIVAAGLLHDVLEDTDSTLQEIKDNFGDRVASLVDEVTSKKEERGTMKKREYLFMKVRKLSSDALTVKLADRLHNIQFLERDMGGKEEKEFLRYYYKETRYVFGSLAQDRDLNEVQKVLMKNIDAVLDFLKLMHNL